MIGGTDPAAFARRHGERVTHVHLKDVDAAIAAELDGWFVLEQDTAITAEEPAVTSASMLAATQSIALNNSAHTTEEIHS